MLRTTLVGTGLLEYGHVIAGMLLVVTCDNDPFVEGIVYTRPTLKASSPFSHGTIGSGKLLDGQQVHWSTCSRCMVLVVSQCYYSTIFSETSVKFRLAFPHGSGLISLCGI